MITELLSAIIFMFTLPLLLKLRNIMYKQRGYTVWQYEDLIFILGLIVVLTVHSMIYDSTFSAALTIGPYTYFSIMIYRMFWKNHASIN